MNLLLKFFFNLIFILEAYSSIAQIDTSDYQYIDHLNRKVGLVPLKETEDSLAARVWLTYQVLDISLSKDTCGRIISFADKLPMQNSPIYDRYVMYPTPYMLIDTLDKDVSLTIYNMVRGYTPKSNLHDNNSVAVVDGYMYFIESLIDRKYNLTAYQFSTMEVFQDQYVSELHFFDSLKLLSKSEDHYDRFMKILVPGQYTRDFVSFTVYTEEEKARQLLFEEHNNYMKSIHDSIAEMFKLTFQKYPNAKLYEQKGRFIISFSKFNRVDKIYYPNEGHYWNPIKRLMTQIRLRKFINQPDLNWIHANYDYFLTIWFSQDQCYVFVNEIE